MVAKLTDPSRETWFENLLSTPASESGFFELRTALIESPPNEDEVAALSAFLATWNTGIRRMAPIEWLWRVSRGEECPELTLCNAIDPDWLFSKPSHDYYEEPDWCADTFEGVNHESWPEEESYIAQLVRDEEYISQQLSIDEWLASSREGGHDDV